MKNNSRYISNLIHSLKEAGDVIFLESQMPEHPASTKSFIAAKPSAYIKAYGDKVVIYEDGSEKKFKTNPWEALKKFKNKHADWMFGYFGYDLKNYIEDLQSDNESLNQAADLFFMVPGLLIEIDTKNQTRILKGNVPSVNSENKAVGYRVKLKHRIEEPAYTKLLKKAQQDIYEGEYYEINLSHPLEFTFTGNSFDLYEAMRAAGPVPFGGYASIGDISICCASPERFLARDGSKVWSQPIKGTVSRDDNTHTNGLEVLRSSDKEKAENLMIVDLVRNDLSKIAKKNTVKVSNLFEIQSFETVHQMVSTVECEVDNTIDNIDLIKACFPMGSMTGAPKIASMQAIEKYEDYKRGIYSGALGYFKPNNDFDFNVLIRTAIIEEQKLVYPVGGAITSDSDPKAEWEETLIKARAITNLLDHSKKPE
ncbi:anthranilate synthase component I family protein [Gracilimonas sp.]|uniref:anthranilate synthase component I family protein n=1 Tax=Gracilimonas sp. TaxID=1974203 RepID=UPI0028728A61|nr:anthranilate synthase component I family protein [Gracilimonas sp.]